MSPRSCIKLEKSAIDSGFLDSFDYVLTDCDGVLWIDNTPIPGSVDTIQALKNLGKEIIYVTNNSTKARSEYITKFENFGLPVKLENIISTSYCVAAFLKAQNFQKKVYVVGTTGIALELQRANIEHLPVGPDLVPDNWFHWLDELNLDPDVGAVVVGFDHYVSFAKIAKASSYLRNPNILFIATNKEGKIPHGPNLIVPGEGTVVAAVEWASERESIAVGKPHKYMLDSIKGLHPNIDFSRCIMIGDRLNTDIMLGTKHGIKTLFVLTGVNSLEDVYECQKSTDENMQLQIPDFYLSCLADLGKLIK